MNAPRDVAEKFIKVNPDHYMFHDYKLRKAQIEALAQLLQTIWDEAATAERENAIIVINEKGDRVLLGWLPPRFEVQTLPGAEK